MLPSFLSGSRAIVFDMDDTLTKSYRKMFEQHKAVAATYGVTLTDDDLRKEYGRPFDDMIGALYRNADTLENMKALHHSFKSQFKKEIQQDAVHAVLCLLEADWRVGVLTAANRDHVYEDLIPLGFPLDRFSSIQGAEETDVHKPHPDVFLPTIRRLAEKGVEKSAVIYVGDGLHDYAAARDAGLAFIGVTTGLISEEQFRLAGATTVVAGVHAIPALFGLG